MGNKPGGHSSKDVEKSNSWEVKLNWKAKARRWKAKAKKLVKAKELAAKEEELTNREKGLAVREQEFQVKIKEFEVKAKELEITTKHSKDWEEVNLERGLDGNIMDPEVTKVVAEKKINNPKKARAGKKRYRKVLTTGRIISYPPEFASMSLSGIQMPRAETDHSSQCKPHPQSWSGGITMWDKMSKLIGDAAISGKFDLKLSQEIAEEGIAIAATVVSAMSPIFKALSNTAYDSNNGWTCRNGIWVNSYTSINPHDTHHFY